MNIGRVLGGVVVVLVIIPVIAAVAAVRLHDHNSPPRLQAHHAAASSTACAKPAIIRRPMVGVAVEQPWGPNLASFMKSTGLHHPQIVAQYLRFGSPYNSALSCQVARAGGELLLQWDPTNVSLQRIASGARDGYITQFARDVRAAQIPIVLSFGHEMNGFWYTWGNTHVPPREFIAAWRHLHQLFVKAGASNVTWCWNVNVWLPGLTGRPNYGITSARRWWPGARYVDWIGLDAYYQAPGDTFHTLFQYSLRALHRIAHKPVLIAETGAAQGPFQARQVRSLFSGLRRSKGVIGAVWFDGSHGRENWKLEGQSAAIAAFRAGARSLARIRKESS